MIYWKTLRKKTMVNNRLPHQGCASDYDLHVSFAGLTTEEIQHCFWKGNHLNVFVTVCNIQDKKT
jgi:hypothetical protein